MSYPALELVWSVTGRPFVASGHAWPLGELAALPPDGLTFGLMGDVRVQYQTRHASVDAFKLDRQLRLWRYSAEPLCWVNGKLRRDREVQLKHRDVVAMPPGPVFRVHERELVRATSPALEAAIRATPDDAELIAVWRDFLLDQGDPLGERIARSRLGPADDDATWLDALAQHYESGGLQIQWRSGLAQRAVLREALAVFPDLDEAVNHLVRLPVMKFLRDLTLDVSSDKLPVSEGLATLSRVTLPSTVRHVSLGDVPDFERERAQLALEKFGVSVGVGYYTEAVLEVVSSLPDANHKAGDKLQVGEQIELGRSGYSSHLSHIVQLGGSYVIARDGPRFVIARLLNNVTHAKVNGRQVDRFPLSDGDLIELGGELTARFKLVR